MFQKKRGKITVGFAAEEIELLRRLINEYLDLLKSEDSEDPVLKRLYPDASIDDPDVSNQYREITGNELARHKNSTAELALALLPEQGSWRGTLTDEDWSAWLVLLTDLRLTLGTRLGVTEETMEVAIDPGDPEQWPLAILHYLGALQDSLVEAVSP